MTQTPKITPQAMRARILGGGRLLLSSLTREELAALQPMLLSQEAEIINEGCKPYVVRKLDRWMV